MTNPSRQSGSVLFLILIAVALFAALSYNVMRGSRTSESQLTEQQAKMAAQEIISYGNTIADTVQKLKLRGCKDTEYSFANNQWVTAVGTPIHAANHNPNAPSDETCSLFEASGGNMQAVIIPKTSLENVAPTGGGTSPGSMYALAVAMPDIGTSAEDIVLVLPYPSKEVCLQINRILGINAVPLHSWVSKKYNGSFGTTGSVTDVNGTLTGLTAYCSNATTATPPDYDNRFFRVLIAR